MIYYDTTKIIRKLSRFYNRLKVIGKLLRYYDIIKIVRKLSGFYNNVKVIGKL